MRVTNLMIAFAFATTLVLAACCEDDGQADDSATAVSDVGADVVDDTTMTDASVEDTVEAVVSDAEVSTDASPADDVETPGDAGTQETSDTE